MPQIHGIGVPFRFGSRGYPEPADDIELLGDSIYTILKTARGDRVRRPTFGSDLHRLIFVNMSSQAKVRARTTAREALRTQEPRVIVDDIVIEQEDEANRIMLTVLWRPQSNPDIQRQTGVPFGQGGE